MGTTGSFDFNLDNVKDITNDSVLLGANITKEIRDMSDIIGIGIAIAVSLSLIAIGILVVIGIPFLIIRKVKAYKKA